MANRAIESPDANTSPFYVQAVETTAGSRVLHVSGQVGVDPGGNVVDGFDAQTRQAFANLKAHLAAADMAITDIVKVTVIVTDQANVAAFRKVRDELMEGHKTASTLIVAGLVSPQMLVEIEAVAAK